MHHFPSASTRDLRYAWRGPSILIVESDGTAGGHPLTGYFFRQTRYLKDLRIKATGLEQRVVTLSGGNQQKVVLSKWLCSRSSILIFDEPTRGIDVGSKAEIYQLMNELTASGAAIIMISSELPEVLNMSDRILVIAEGEIVGELSRAEATQERCLELASSKSSRAAA